MKKIYPFIYIIALILGTGLKAQEFGPHQKYLVFGFNYSPFGVVLPQHISGQGRELGRKAGFIAGNNGRGGHSLAGFNSIGVNTGFMWSGRKKLHHTAIVLELQQNRASYSFYQPFAYTYTTQPEQDNDADDTVPITHTVRDKWMEMDRYLKYSVSVQRFWNIKQITFDDDIFFYSKLSLGQSFLHRSMGRRIKQGDYETHEDDRGNAIEALTTSLNPVSNVFGAELGFRVMNYETKGCFDIGLGCVLPVQSTYTRDYNFYGTSRNGNSVQPIKVGSSEYRFNGASIYLNMSYSFNAQIKSRPPDTLMHEKKRREKPEPVAHIHKPHHLNGRKVKIHDEVDCDEETLVIEVYDKGKIDGDRISLYLNGDLLLEDYTVGKIKKELILHLKPGENYLVMHALNLGRIPPNTAAIRIYKDGKPKDIILNSDMDRSGGLKINYRADTGGNG